MCPLTVYHGRYFLLIYFSISLLTLKTTAESRECAVLLSNKNPWIEQPLQLSDGSVFGNLADEYLTTDKSWNTSAIWKVTPSCRLKACNGPYLSGNCETFLNGTQFTSRNWLYARCVCSLSCSCSDVLIKSSVCAHAYLEHSGCRDCNGQYTELGIGSYDTFPKKWTHKVSSILVRPGCKLTAFVWEYLEGYSETIFGPTMRKRKDPFGSYRCKCDASRDLHHPKVVNPFLGQQSIRIPDSIDDVISEYTGSDVKRPGLLAALSSLLKRRSSKNVYMLLLGSTGAEKSSAINTLLGGNLIEASDMSSTTSSEIHEYRLPVLLPELAIKDSELRIIDTPALGDTKDTKRDALLLGTLDEYLSTHEELKTKIPNLVLTFNNIHNNRFDTDEGSQFVRMIQELGTIRDRITDENFSNVLFIFSHLCSVDEEHQKNPAPLVLKFKEVVERYSFFPNPIQTLVIETRGTQYQLPMRNGGFELPNGEYFPQNLNQKLDSITKSCEDKIGNAVMNTKAFTSRLVLKIGANTFTKIIYPLLSPNHRRVEKYFGTLNLSLHTFKTTEVSILLDQASMQMNYSTLSQFSLGLEKLQGFLSLKGIKSMSDLPETPADISKLFSEIEKNNETFYILKQALNLEPPIFPGNTVVGYSFDIRKNSILSTSPFQMDIYQESNTGFKLPTVVKSTAIKRRPVSTFITFDSRQEYFQSISTALLGERLSSAIVSSDIMPILTNKLKDGFFVRNMAICSGGTRYCFTVTRLYPKFEFQIDSKSAIFNSKFIQQLENISSPNYSHYDRINGWISLFNEFGTHVVKSADVGGCINIQFAVRRYESVDDAVQNVLKCFDYLDDPLSSATFYKQNWEIVSSECAEINYKLVFHGGNSTYHVSNILKLSLDQGITILQNWKESIQYYPSVFPDVNMPICELLSGYGIIRSCENALRTLLGSSLSHLNSI